MAVLLFIDPLPQPPYSPADLAKRGLGGTEATVLRIAEELGKRHQVYVAQKLRTASPEEPTRAHYIFHADIDTLKRPDRVIVIKNPFFVKRVRKRFPKAPLYLWAHDEIKSWGWIFWRLLTDLEVTLVLVSDFHRKQALANIRPRGLNRLRSKRRTFKAVRVYNPVDDDLQPDDTNWDRNKLIFTSSPHKGLRQTLEMFQRVRRSIPELELHIANPGYMQFGNKGAKGWARWFVNLIFPDVKKTEVSRLSRIENLKVIGSLPQTELMRQVRRSLCVFYPNPVFAETFGLVFAESNAVGTPVLAHPIGAAQEVLSDRSQLVEHDAERITDLLTKWRKGNRPTLHCRPEFRLSTVARSWESMLRIN